jgi:predicted transcriptional regulator of viral defense system
MHDALLRLPTTFRFSKARQAGLSRSTIRRMKEEGRLLSLGRGIYRLTEAGQEVDTDLITLALRAPSATLCLTTALAHHDLSDTIPTSIDVAVPRGNWTPIVEEFPVTWHYFARKTFDLGRETLKVDREISIGIYNPERCIVDAFRMSGREGTELGYDALRRYINRGGQPGPILGVAKLFPRSLRALVEAIRILMP